MVTVQVAAGPTVDDGIWFESFTRDRLVYYESWLWDDGWTHW